MLSLIEAHIYMYNSETRIRMLQRLVFVLVLLVLYLEEQPLDERETGLHFEDRVERL